MGLSQGSAIADTGEVKCCVTVTLAAMLLLTASPSYGWGREGHQLIARLAASQLSPKTKSAVSALLDPGETLESVSTWADEIRPKRPETSTWHYINIPVTAKGDWRRYCPDTDCVVSIVQKLERRMADASLSRTERRETLFFLIHFLSDLHQPLHTGDKGDRGGNDVQTVYRNYAGNLHGTWDTGLILGYKETDPALSNRVMRPASAWERRRTARGGPEQWVWQSHAIARDVAYPHLPAQRPALLGEDYARAAKSSIEKQLRRAGLRVAAVLNRILGS